MGQSHPKQGDTYNNMAVALTRQGKLTEAMGLHKKAEAIYLATNCEKHPALGDTYNDMALALKQQGKLTEAMDLYKKAEAIYLATKGENHPALGAIYNNMAVVLERQGKLTEAMDLCKKAGAIYLATMGQSHPKQGDTYINMALVLERQGKLTEAMDLCKKAEAIYLATNCENYPALGNIYNNMAVVLERQGKLAEAMDLCKKAEAIYLATNCENHPALGNIYNNMAVVLERQGKLAESMDLFKKAEAICLATEGQSHPVLGNTYHNMAYLLWRQGKRTEAMDLHPKAEWKSECGDSKAMALLEKALNIRIRGLGEANEKVGQAFGDTAYDALNDSLKHWVIIGGGPVGLTLALLVSELMQGFGLDPAEAHVTVYESRMEKRDGRWCRIGRRRDQVVTLQDDVLRLLEEHMLFRDVFEGERVWRNSRNCAIADLEDRLLKAAGDCPFIKLKTPEPSAMKGHESHLAWFRCLDADIVVVANGAASFTREALRWPRVLLGDGDPELNLTDYALGIGLAGDTGPLQSQALNVVLTLCQNRYLLNSIEGKRGYLNIRVTKGEYDELFKATGSKGCEFGTPIVLHDSFQESPEEHVRMLENAVPRLERTITDGLKLFGMQRDHVRDIVGIQLRPAYVKDFFSIMRQPGGKRVPVLLVGDAAISHHFWPGRGLNTGLKAAVAVAQMWSGGGKSKPRWGSVSKGLLTFQSFMETLREREMQGRSASMMRKSNMLPQWIDELSGARKKDSLRKEKERAKNDNEELLLKAACAWRDAMERPDGTERLRPAWPHADHLSNDELRDKLCKRTVRPAALTVAIMQESARQDPARPAVSGWPVHQQVGAEVDPKDFPW